MARGSLSGPLLALSVREVLVICTLGAILRPGRATVAPAQRVNAVASRIGVRGPEDVNQREERAMSAASRHGENTRYAYDDAKHGFFAGIVERCADAVWTAVGESRATALFMTGAPSRGEATIVETSDGLYSLSDVDLVCIARPDIDLAAARADAARAIAALNRELGGVCVGADASVKPHGYAAHLPPFISHYELVRTPVLLRGNRAAAELLGSVDINEIPADDALRFVHNRCIERLLTEREAVPVMPLHTAATAELDHRRRELRTLRSYYSTAKLMLDLVTAFLFVHRHVPVGYAERVRLFIDDYCERPEFGALAEEIDPFLEELPFWAEFKTTGDTNALRSSLSAGALGGEHAAPFALMMWKRVLGDVLGEDLSLASLSRSIDRLAAMEGPARSIARTLKTLTSGSRRSLYPVRVALRGAPHASPNARAYITGLLLFFSGLGSAAGPSCADIEQHEHHAGPIGGPTLRAPREWTREALARYAPFSLPSGLSSKTDEEMRILLLSRLARFHEEALLGRTRSDDGTATEAGTD